jgi:aldehyde dehydrogenase (NAD+)
MKDIGGAMSDEMGAPLGFTERFRPALASALDDHPRSAPGYSFDESWSSAMIVREPVGVVGVVTPELAAKQIACKVAPAWQPVAMVLKPSEHALVGTHLRRILDLVFEGRLQSKWVGSGSARP